MRVARAVDEEYHVGDKIKYEGKPRTIVEIYIEQYRKGIGNIVYVLDNGVEHITPFKIEFDKFKETRK